MFFQQRISDWTGTEQKPQIFPIDFKHHDVWTEAALFWTGQNLQDFRFDKTFNRTGSFEIKKIKKFSKYNFFFPRIPKNICSSLNSEVCVSSDFWEQEFKLTHKQNQLPRTWIKTLKNTSTNSKKQMFRSKNTTSNTSSDFQDH